MTNSATDWCRVLLTPGRNDDESGSRARCSCFDSELGLLVSYKLMGLDSFLTRNA